MATRFHQKLLVLTWVSTAVAGTGSALAQAPSPEQALKLVPMQKEVDFDRPSGEVASKCTIKAEKIGGKTGWVVRDASGQILRNFVDTNKDNVVDQWSYFKGGIETYRDIDSNYNGKADQSRWLNVGGTRWGIDKDENGQIDLWKGISAEEVTAEIVAAIAAADASRFARVLATPAEIEALDLDTAKATELTDKVKAAPESFSRLVKEKKLLPAESKWVYFGGGRPGMVPATGTGAGDLVVYENVTAMVDTAGKSGQVDIGTLVRIGDSWRVIDVPASLSGAQGFTFYGGENREEVAASNTQGPSENVLKALRDLEILDKAMANAATPEELSKLNTQRADLVEQLAKDADTTADRETWYRDLGDTVLAAVQTSAYPDGVERLKKVADELTANEAEAESAAIIQFRLLKAEYFLAQQTDKNFAEIQDKWLKDLETFVTEHPTSADAADAMMELATAHEFAGNDSKP